MKLSSDGENRVTFGEGSWIMRVHPFLLLYELLGEAITNLAFVKISLHHTLYSCPSVRYSMKPLLAPYLDHTWGNLTIESSRQFVPDEFVSGVLDYWLGRSRATDKFWDIFSRMMTVGNYYKVSAAPPKLWHYMYMYQIGPISTNIYMYMAPIPMPAEWNGPFCPVLMTVNPVQASALSAFALMIGYVLESSWDCTTLVWPYCMWSFQYFTNLSHLTTVLHINTLIPVLDEPISTNGPTPQQISQAWIICDCLR